MIAILIGIRCLLNALKIASVGTVQCYHLYRNLVSSKRVAFALSLTFNNESDHTFFNFCQHFYKIKRPHIIFNIEVFMFFLLDVYKRQKLMS